MKKKQWIETHDGRVLNVAYVQAFRVGSKNCNEEGLHLYAKMADGLELIILNGTRVECTFQMTKLLRELPMFDLTGQ